MLRLVAASITLAGVGGFARTPHEKILPRAQRPLEATPSVPTEYATPMVIDGFAMGLVVRSHEGRPTKIDGNPAHPGPARASSPEAEPPSARRYVYAWLALVVLTLLSFVIDRLQLGAVSTAIALAVALAKASIVFVVFMHLDREPSAIRFVAALNVAWVLLCLGIAADVVMLGTRAHGSRPGPGQGGSRLGREPDPAPRGVPTAR